MIVLVVAGWRFWRVQQDRHTHGHALLAGGVLALVAVLAQGYIGGRMTYDHGRRRRRRRPVRADRRPASASSTSRWPRAPLRPRRAAQAFARSGLGCASCHGDQAQGLRGPSLAGGAELEEFRGVHGTGCSRRPS